MPTLSHPHFPNSASDPFRITSPKDKRYNCIAWAYGRDNIRLWPVLHPLFSWPPGIPRDESINAFIQLFQGIGYEVCGFDSNPEDGYEKVVLFATPDGRVKHAAKQIGNKWSSKLGEHEDCSHNISAMTGGVYGFPVIYLRRKTQPANENI